MSTIDDLVFLGKIWRVQGKVYRKLLGGYMSPEKGPFPKDNSLPTIILNVLVLSGIFDMYDMRSQVLVLSQCARSDRASCLLQCCL